MCEQNTCEQKTFEQKINDIPYNIIAGVLFISYLLLNTHFYDYVFNSSGSIFHIYFFMRLIRDIGIVVSAVMLFKKKRDKEATIGFCLMAFSSLIILLGVDFSFINILELLTTFSLAFIVLISCMDILVNAKDLLNKIWFLPIIFAVISAIVSFFAYFFFRHILFTYSFSILSGISYIGAIAFSALWFADKKIDFSMLNTNNSMPNINNSINDSQGIPTAAYCNLLKHTLLLVFTFGIWALIWIYRTTANLNCLDDEENRTPTTKLLLCIFVPFYLIYWMYKSAQRIDKIANAKGVQSDISIACLITSIFVFILAPIIMQDKINAIIIANPLSANEEKGNGATIGIADELQKCKDLLDSGVIAQDEFDAIKKKLLAL